MDTEETENEAMDTDDQTNNSETKTVCPVGHVQMYEDTTNCKVCFVMRAWQENLPIYTCKMCPRLLPDEQFDLCIYCSTTDSDNKHKKNKV